MTVDAYDCHHVYAAEGLLAQFNQAGILDTGDVHVAMRITALAHDTDQYVMLAVGFIVKALRNGSICVDLSELGHDLDDQLPWPQLDDWLRAVCDSHLYSNNVLRLLDQRLLYLDRYWTEEEQICHDLLALQAPSLAGEDNKALHRLFPADNLEQRRVAQIVLTQPVTVITGGPGTGKTTTIARLLALLTEQAAHIQRQPLRIGLAAPTGKAAACLSAALAGQLKNFDRIDQQRLGTLQATTLHTLLGSRIGSSRFRYNRENPLPHDVIVIDETSMVSLTMMARLVEALQTGTRLILVGDPDQLASVEAGAILADLVEGLSCRSHDVVVRLHTVYRYNPSIGQLAEAIRRGDADAVIDLLSSGDESLSWIDPCQEEDPYNQLAQLLVNEALQIRKSAVYGDDQTALALLQQHRLLCAHREGTTGITYWNQLVRRRTAEQLGESAWTNWYVGRPLLVTANNYQLGIHNGDIGITIIRDGQLRAVIQGANQHYEFNVTRLDQVETMYAMTIHKSQGSEIGEVSILMPSIDSRLLTRELLYTAVTRAKNHVRIIGSVEEIRAALTRRALRASGLALRLQRC